MNESEKDSLLNQALELALHKGIAIGAWALMGIGSLLAAMLEIAPLPKALLFALALVSYLSLVLLYLQRRRIQRMEKELRNLEKELGAFSKEERESRRLHQFRTAALEALRK